MTWYAFILPWVVASILAAFILLMIFDCIHGLEARIRLLETEVRQTQKLLPAEIQNEHGLWVQCDTRLKFLDGDLLRKPQEKIQ